MPLTNLNIKPYFDDFDDQKNFVHVLFRPGYPVQSRELTTLQSILKDQIEKFGDHFFKNGSNILDGGINVGTVDVLNISSFDLLYEIEYSVSDGAGNTQQIRSTTTTNEDIRRLEGLTIVGADSGIEAKVLKVIDNSAQTPISLQPIQVVVSYTKTGAINSAIAEREGMDVAPISVDGIDYSEGVEVSRFLFGEQIAARTADNLGLISRPYAAAFEQMVQGAMAFALPGVYYVSGNFIQTEQQSLLLATSSQRDITPEISYKIGFTVNTSIITPSEDDSLLDNAEGATSFGTEGAHRLKSELILDKREIESTENVVNEDQNFIELIRYIDNELALDISDKSQYNELVDTLARRTYDESGDYYLNPFKLELSEDASDPAYLTAQLGPSKAYVRGYEIEKLITTNLEIPRPRTEEFIKNMEVDIEVGNTILMDGSVNINAVDFGNREVALIDGTDDELAFGRVVTLGNGENTIGLGSIQVVSKLAITDETGFVENEVIFSSTGGQAYVIKVDTGLLYLTNINGRIENGDTITSQDGATSTTATADLVKQDISTATDVRVLSPSQDLLIDPAATFAGKSAEIVYDTGKTVKTQEPIDNAFSYYAPTGINNYYSIQVASDANPTQKEYKTNVHTFDSYSETLGGELVFTVSQDNGDITLDSGTGTGLELIVEVDTAGEYTIKGVNNGGAGFAQTDVIRVLGSTIGGADGDAPNNDIVITLEAGFVGPDIDITDLQNPSNATVVTTPIDRSAGATALTNSYGFRADDLEIALEVDVNKVFAVLESTENNLPPRGNQLLLDTAVSLTEAFKVGYKIVGQESGTEAIVYRSNATSSANLNYHLYDIDVGSPVEYQFADVTGSEDTVEIVKLSGPGFEAGEVIVQTYRDQSGPVIGAPQITIERTVSSASNFYVPTTSNDITSKFIVDTGQRKTSFDLGRLRYKPFEERASRKIGVMFSYYNTDSGDASYFCNVDSYPLYEDIKVNYHETYDPSNFNNEYEIPELRDYIDFRKIRNFDHLSYRAGTPDANPFAFRNIDYFEAQTPLPVDETTFFADTTVYKARIDKIFLNKDGNFVDVKGAPSFNPKEPVEIDDSMLLFDLEIPAYCRDVNGIKIEAADNRRYTMRDIGAIERNVTELQELVSLNTLELAAASEYIPDAADQTINRLKLGFIADPFLDETKTDIEDPDNTCVVDFDSLELKPSQVQESINLIEGSDNAGEKGTGYVVNDGMVTIDYTAVPYISQLKASDTIKINPYDAWSWVGTMNISPSRDFWRTRSNNTRYVVVNNSTGEVQFTNSPSRFSKWLKPVSTRRRNSTVRGWRGLSRRWLTTFENRVNERTTSVREAGKTYVSSSIDKMRGKNIEFKADMLRPNTKLIAKFDGKDVTRYCRQYINNDPNGDLKSEAGALKSDFLGQISGVFALPDNEFETGRKSFWIGSDETQLDFTNAEAFYDASGVHTNVTTTIRATRSRFTERRAIRSWKDPIAQTFLMEHDGFLDSVDFWASIVEGDERYKTTAEIEDIFTAYGLYGLDQLFSNDLDDAIANGGGPSASANVSSVLNAYPTSLWYTNNDSVDKQLFPSSGSFIALMETEVSATTSDGPFVSLEVVTVDNGFPTQDTVPGSFVKLYPGNLQQFGFKENKLYSSGDASQKSTAKFDYPIYLKGDTEYALVLKSPSGRNGVYISTLGERTIDTDEYISSQPYLGSLFTSQNSSTWTPEQTKDLKFEIKRCKFNTSAQLRVVNELIEDYRPIGVNQNGVAVETFAGSNIVRIHHKNHSMFNAASLGYAGSSNNVLTHGVKLLNVPDVDNTGTFNGIPLAELNNASLTVYNFTNEWYEVAVSSNADKSGLGGADVIGSQAVQFNELDLMANVIQPQNTVLQATIETKKYGSSVGNYDVNVSKLSEEGKSVIPKIEIPINEPYELEQPVVITSKVHDSNTSVIININMQSDNDFLSPVVDLQDLELLTVRNVIDFKDIDDQAATYGQEGIEALSKHVTVPVKLNNPAKAIKFTFDYEMTKFNKIGLYYKAIPKGSDVPFDELEWQFGAYITNPNETVGEFIVNDIPEFDEYKVMIVLQSWSEAKYPVVKNLRVISTAS